MNQNYYHIICPHSQEGKTCGKVYFAECAECVWKRPLSYTVSSIQYWQLCPKCNGSGYINSHNYTSSVCDVCNGKKIISTLTGLPPGFELKGGEG